MEKCTKKITDWLIRCDAVEEADRDYMNMLCIAFS